MSYGIYKIECVKNGKCYIGASTNLENRKKNHFNSLKKGEHTNREMQLDYNEYGEENFTYEVLKICEELSGDNIGYKHSLVSLNSDMSNIETMYIKKFDSYYHGYNKTVKIQSREGKYTNTELMKIHDNNFIRNDYGFYELRKNAKCNYLENSDYDIIDIIKERILNEIDGLSEKQKSKILEIIKEESETK